MKKHLLLLLSLLLVATTSFAERVSQEDAALVASNFMNAGTTKSGAKTSAAKKMTLKKAASATENQYYIYENANGGGWVMVSASNAAHPIIAYSPTGSFNLDNQPSNVKNWLGKYEKQIKYAEDNGIVATDEVAEEWNALRTAPPVTASGTVVVEPLIKTTWDQDDPYWAYTPSYKNEKTYTGCVATAMAQVMNYWQWPKTGTGSYSYTSEARSLSCSADFANTTYDWDNMVDHYTKYYSGTSQISVSTPTTAQKEAVATLMYHCGVAAEMDYNIASSGGSGAMTIYPNATSTSSRCAAYALINNFGYKSSTLKCYYRPGGYGYSKVSDANWLNLLKTELDAKRPIMYAGADDEGGHSFVCDGYDSNNYFHFNWGWSGYCDGYYTVNNMVPGTGGSGSGNGSYNDDQDIIIGIVPDKPSSPVSSITISPATLTLKQNEKSTLSKTVLPTDAEQSVTWTSSNTAVATVTSAGVVKGVAQGTATITATANDDSGKKATCAVTVTSEVLEDYTDVHETTDGITGEGTNVSAAQIIIDGTTYDGWKMGTSKVVGVLTLTIPAKTTKVYLHAAAWKGTTVTVTPSVTLSAASGAPTPSASVKHIRKATAPSVTPSELSVKANEGVSNNSPFTLSGEVGSDYYFELDLTGIDSEASLTLTPASGRYVVWGVNVKTDGDPITPPDPGTDASITANPTSLSFEGTLSSGSYSASKTITVTGTNLSTESGNDISVTLSGDYAQFFTVTPTSLPVAGGELTVAFSTEYKGSYYAASLKLESFDADLNVISTEISLSADIADEATPPAGGVDVLNNANTINSTSSTYADWTTTGTSGAVYAGQSAGGNSSIQLRSNNNNSGIVVTTSAGNVSKVVLVWNSNTAAGRKVNIYGSNTAYSAPSDLYGDNCGDLLGTLEYDVTTELTLSDAYAYIGIRSASGALYLDEVQITWGDGGSSQVCTPVGLNIDATNATTAYFTNETFSTEGLVVEMVYLETECASKVVTGWTASAPDMTTEGEKTVTITYFLDETPYTETYTILVVAPTAFNITVGTLTNGSVVAPATAYEGSTVQLTVTPADGYKLETLTVLDANNEPVLVTNNTFVMPSSNVTISAVFVEEGVTPTPSGDGDILTNSNTIKSTASTYAEWTTTGESGAVYAGQSAGGKESIQLRSNNSNSGIVVTTSAGNVSSVRIVFNSETDAARVVSLYGSNTAYSAPSDLYTSTTQGTLIKEVAIADGASQTITLTDDYAYIGIRSKSGALYLDTVQVVWAGGSTPPECTPVGLNIDATNATTAYFTNETFSTEGLVVEMVYLETECASKVVTGWTASAPDMTTEGEKEVTISYVLNETTYTEKYNIIVVAPTSYTITVSAMTNGSVVAPASAYEGAEVALTVTPADGYKLESLTVLDGNNEPVAVTNNTFVMPASNVTISATFVEDVAPAGDVDILNNANTINSTSSTYADWTTTGTSGAVYAGQSAGGNSSIQLRSNNNNSGIVVTTSAGNVSKVVLVWNSNTAAGRKVNIYGSNTAYSAPSDLYGDNCGDLLGTLEYDVTTELTLSDAYAYIGIRSASGALYLDEVQITWSNGSVPPVTTTYTVTYKNCGQDITQTYNAGDPLVLPTDTPADNNGKKFYGWIAAETYTGDTAPALVEEGGAVNANATYYAVYK